MKKSLKAALLSAIVYPGAGHFFLNKYSVCAAFAGTFSVPLYFIVSEVIAKAENIVEQINNGDIPLGISAIAEALSRSTAGADAQSLDFIMCILVVVWIIAIIDSYRIARKIV
jgi:hypothetical protein